jgi:hypothetical protein
MLSLSAGHDSAGEEAGMATAMGAIKGFFHLFTADWVLKENSASHVVTVLDVLEPRHPQV